MLLTLLEYFSEWSHSTSYHSLLANNLGGKECDQICQWLSKDISQVSLWSEYYLKLDRAVESSSPSRGPPFSLDSAYFIKYLLSHKGHSFVGPLDVNHSFSKHILFWKISHLLFLLLSLLYSQLSFSFLSLKKGFVINTAIIIQILFDILINTLALALFNGIFSWNNLSFLWWRKNLSLLWLLLGMIFFVLFGFKDFFFYLAPTLSVFAHLYIKYIMQN